MHSKSTHSSKICCIAAEWNMGREQEHEKKLYLGRWVVSHENKVKSPFGTRTLLLWRVLGLMRCTHHWDLSCKSLLFMFIPDIDDPSLWNLALPVPDSTLQTHTHTHHIWQLCQLKPPRHWTHTNYMSYEVAVQIEVRILYLAFWQKALQMPPLPGGNKVRQQKKKQMVPLESSTL